VEFKVEGGEGPIVIDGVDGVYNPVGKVFTSDLIPCGETYEIIVTDKNGCKEILTGQGECNCTTQAGQLPFGQVETCGNNSAFVGPSVGFTKDTNDVETYVLLAQDNFDHSKILASEEDGIFSNELGLLTEDQAYYVFHLVGNSMLNGEIDLSDPCLVASNSRPIIFYSKPSADAGGDTIYCEGVFNLRAVKSKSQSQGLWTQVDGPSTAIIDKVNEAHTVVITDQTGVYAFEWLESYKGCLSRDTSWVEIKQAIEVIIIGPDSICNGQAASLMTEQAYESYLWDDGQNTRMIQISGPGEYCVRVFTNAGCSKRVCLEVKNSFIDIPSIMGSDVLCPGEEEVLQVVPKYDQYKWSTGDSIFFITIDQADTYCITVTDFNGCTASDCIEVEPFRNRTTNATDSICHGDTVTVFGEKLYRSGQYNLRMNDGQKCDSVVELQLLVFDSIYISDSLITKDDGSSNGAISVNIKGGKPPYKYLWSNGADIPFIHNLQAGIYSLVVTDDNDCSQSFLFDLRNNTAVRDVGENALIVSIGPNPVKAGAHLQVFIDDQNRPTKMRYEIHAANGILVYSDIINFDYTSKSGFIPISEKMEGVYLLHISDMEDNNGGVYTIIVTP
jgi:hypothetical protein